MDQSASKSISTISATPPSCDAMLRMLPGARPRHTFVGLSRSSQSIALLIFANANALSPLRSDNFFTSCSCMIALDRNELLLLATLLFGFLRFSVSFSPPFAPGSPNAGLFSPNRDLTGADPPMKPFERPSKGVVEDGSCGYSEMLGGMTLLPVPFVAVVTLRNRVFVRRGFRMARVSVVPASGGFGLGSRTFRFACMGSEGCGGMRPRRKSSRRT